MSIYDRARSLEAADGGTPKPQPKTVAELRALAEERRNSERLAEILRREEQAAAIRNAPSEVTARNPYESLTTEELLQLDTFTKREQAQRAEFEAQFVSLSTWCLANTSFPARPDAADKLVNYCKARNQSMAHRNLDAAWQALQAEGLRPDYSKRNAAAHEENAEQLRAAGLRVDAAPDPHTASPEDMDIWMRTQQPPPTLNNLQPQPTDSWVSPFDRPNPEQIRDPRDF